MNVDYDEVFSYIYDQAWYDAIKRYAHTVSNLCNMPRSNLMGTQKDTSDWIKKFYTSYHVKEVVYNNIMYTFAHAFSFCKEWDLSSMQRLVGHANKYNMCNQQQKYVFVLCYKTFVKIWVNKDHKEFNAYEYMIKIFQDNYSQKLTPKDIVWIHNQCRWLIDEYCRRTEELENDENFAIADQLMFAWKTNQKQ